MRSGRHNMRVSLSDGQLAYVRRKAQSMGLSISELVRRSVEAYVRTFDEVAPEGTLVAVNYACLLRLEISVDSLSQALSACARQLAGLRRAASKGTDGGGTSPELMAELEGVHAELARIRCGVDAALGRLDALDAARSACWVVDFNLGGLPADATEEEADMAGVGA